MSMEPLVTTGLRPGQRTLSTLLHETGYSTGDGTREHNIEAAKDGVRNQLLHVPPARLSKATQSLVGYTRYIYSSSRLRKGTGPI